MARCNGRNTNNADSLREGPVRLSDCSIKKEEKVDTLARVCKAQSPDSCCLVHSLAQSKTANVCEPAVGRRGMFRVTINLWFSSL